MLYLFTTTSNVAYSAEKILEDFVKEFYTWYITRSIDSDEILEENDDIYKYVHACTVNKLQITYRKGLMFSNYFFQTNGFDPRPGDIPIVTKSVKITETVSIVPVGYHGSDWQTEPYLIVFVENQKGGLRITKVEDIR